MSRIHEIISPEGCPGCRTAYEALNGCVDLIDYVNNDELATNIDLGEPWVLLEPLIREHFVLVDSSSVTEQTEVQSRALLFHLIEAIRGARRSGNSFVLDSEQEWLILDEESKRFLEQYRKEACAEALKLIGSDRLADADSDGVCFAKADRSAAWQTIKECTESRRMEIMDASTLLMRQGAQSCEKRPAATYGYYIDLDERGDFRADVRDESGKTVFEILAGDSLEEDETSIFDDGFMRNTNDLSGLTKHLIDLGVIPAGSDVLPRGEFEARIEEVPAPK